jgi:hypothetical protein
MQFRNVFGSMPTDLIRSILRIAEPQKWPEVFVVCSESFRLERCLLALHPGVAVHSNDVSLLSTAVAKYALGEELDFHFKDELSFLEDVGLADYGERVAAVIVAATMGTYASGRPNPTKAAHLAHYRRNFLEYVRATRGKLDSVREELPIASYYAGDWLDHMEEAIRRGAGVIGYPPTAKSNPANSFAFVHANVDWQAPHFRIFDPKDIPQVLNRLDSGGVPYLLCAERGIDGRQPVIESNPKGKATIYGYSSGTRSGYLDASTGFEPFAYEPLDLTRLTENSVCRIIPSSTYRLNFLRHVYLKKSIAFAQGDAHLLVYLDDMLAGGIVYRLGREAFSPVELLSDFATTRQGRVAKLIARLATTRAAVSVIERRFVDRYQRLTTQAFSDHPVAMKYRGSWEVTKRVEDDRQGAKYVLTYESEVRDEDPQRTYAHWWKRDGARQVAEARNRNQEGRSADAGAA